MIRLVLFYKGCDSHDRPVYEDSHGNLYVDTDPRKSRAPHICTKYKNAFDGEPDNPIAESTKITFVPCRNTWNWG